MAIKVLLKSDRSGARAAFVKLQKGEASPGKDAIELTLYRKYDRIPYVIFTEGNEREPMWSGTIPFDMDLVIANSRDDEYETVELER